MKRPDSKRLEMEARQQIEAMEEEHRRAVLNRDIEALDRHEADDIIVTSPSNTIVMKPQFLDSVRTGRISHSRFDKHIEKIAIHGDCAIAMGSETVVAGGTGPDTGRTIHRRYTDVYVRKDGRWVMVARHANVIPS